MESFNKWFFKELVKEKAGQEYKKPDRESNEESNKEPVKKKQIKSKKYVNRRMRMRK